MRDNYEDIISEILKDIQEKQIFSEVKAEIFQAVFFRNSANIIYNKAGEKHETVIRAFLSLAVDLEEKTANPDNGLY